MASPLLVGLDMGTTNIKAVAYEPDGTCVAVASSPMITHYPRPTWAYWEPEELWDLACGVLRRVVARIGDPRRIAGVAVASVGEAGVPLDARGEPTYPVIAWFDRRTLDEAGWLAERIGETALFASTGLSLQPIFSLCKLLWIRAHEPGAWARTTQWLHVADYIAYRLSGARGTDYSLASRTLMFNLRQLNWDREILREAEIPLDLLAPAIASGTRIGTVTAGAAMATGLPAGAVVAAGGHDHVCGALAAGIVEPGAVCDSMGTAEAVFVALEQPIGDPEFGRQGYTQGAHTVPGRYYAFGGLYTSGASVEWFRDVVGRDHTLDDLIAEAATAPAGSLGVTFLPHLRLASPPHDDARSRGAFVGLTTDASRAVLARALLEGIAFEGRATLAPLLTYAGIDQLDRVTLIGGGAKNHLLVQIKASAQNAAMRTVELEEATALGAAMLAGVGAGIYPDTRAAANAIHATPHIVAPVPADVERYETTYRTVFGPLYEILRELNHRIHQLAADPTAGSAAVGAIAPAHEPAR